MATSNKIGSDKIRIRLKAYDYVVLDQSAEKIVETAKRTGAKVSRTNSTSNRERSHNNFTFST